ncbi:MAG: ATP-binding protein [Pseudomonadota bacterium]
MPRTPWILIVIFLLTVAIAGGLVWTASYRAALDRLAETGQFRVEQTAERLVSQLERYKVLVNVLAQNPKVIRALRSGEDAGAIGSYLRDHVLAYGAERIELVDRFGTVIASSDEGQSQVTRRGDRLVRAAMEGRLGLEHVLEARTRQFRLSRGVIRGVAPPAGAVIVTTDIAALEFEWSFVPEAVGFFDPAGIVYVANRPSLLLSQDRSLGADARFDAFPAHIRTEVGPHELWTFEPGAELPPAAIVVSRSVPQIDMLARGFIDVGPARSVAWQQALLTGALIGLLGLASVIVALWRRRLADRLDVEAAANARLEARVEQRTAELRATQQQLVQASKMTALGQLSAGISHELNQPLAAILNFASNAERFLDRAQPKEASENLRHISGQVTRITRIVRNLRGFARAEEEPLEPVDLVAAIDTALALVATAIAEHQIQVKRPQPSDPVMVMGGEIRLQQVIVNLLTNAIDAMAGRNHREIVIDLHRGARDAVLTVRDTGPGISDPSRVFEPFYTTKQLGASKGLGLGLSISYGIVGSFGGEIAAANAPSGGAEFSIRLPLTRSQETT